MFFKLASTNLTRQFKDFLIYFVTVLFGVSLFYAFNTFQDQEAVLKLSEQSSSLLSLLQQVLSGVSIFVAVFMVFLVLYADRFLARRRKKEFATYLLLGMQRSHLIRLISLENLLLGALSLAVGLPLGIALSEGLLIVSQYLFEAPVKGFVFFISVSALVKTIVLFIGIFLLASIISAGSIMKSSIISLMRANRINSRCLVKSPTLACFLFVLSVVMIGLSYWALHRCQLRLFEPIGLMSLALVVVGSALFFYSFAGLIVTLTQHISGWYYKGIHCFTIRQIASKINVSFASLTVSTFALFFALCSILVGTSMIALINERVNAISLYDASVTSSNVAVWRSNFEHSNLSLIDPDGYKDEALKADIHSQFVTTLASAYDNLSNEAKGFVDNPLDAAYAKFPDKAKSVKEAIETATVSKFYYDPNMLGESFSKATGLSFSTNVTANGDYEFMPVTIMSVSDFNAMRKLAGEKPIELDSNSMRFVHTSDDLIANLNKMAEKKPQIEVFGTKLILQAPTIKFKALDFDSQFIIVVVPDQVIPKQAHPITTQVSIKLKDKSDAAQSSVESLLKDYRELYLQSPNDDGSEINLGGGSRREIYSAVMGVSASIAYIGIYFSLILTMACAAILAIQQLNEVNDSARRYETLRELGVAESRISRSLFVQMLFFFILPLGMAAAHATCVMDVLLPMLKVLGNFNFMHVMLVAAAFFVLIYGVYFILTFVMGKGIIKPKQSVVKRSGR